MFQVCAASSPVTLSAFRLASGSLDADQVGRAAVQRAGPPGRRLTCIPASTVDNDHARRRG